MPKIKLLSNYSKYIFLDNRLTLKEISILFYFISTRNEEEINYSGEALSKKFKISSKTANKIIQNLLKYGYIKRNRIKNEKGQWLRTEIELSEYVNIPMKKQDVSKVKKIKEYAQNSNEIRLAKLLYIEILKHDPKYKKPDFQKWANEIDKLHRIDGREYNLIEEIILFCQHDKFWQSNILSTKKLRDKFTMLLLRKKNKKNACISKNRYIKIDPDNQIWDKNKIDPNLIQ